MRPKKLKIFQFFSRRIGHRTGFWRWRWCALSLPVGFMLDWAGLSPDFSFYEPIFTSKRCHRTFITGEMNTSWELECRNDEWLHLRYDWLPYFNVLHHYIPTLVHDDDPNEISTCMCPDVARHRISNAEATDSITHLVYSAFSVRFFEKRKWRRTGIAQDDGSRSVCP